MAQDEYLYINNKVNLKVDLNKNYEIIVFVRGEQKDSRELNLHLLQQKINRQYLKMKKNQEI